MPAETVPDKTGEPMRNLRWIGVSLSIAFCLATAIPAGAATKSPSNPDDVVKTFLQDLGAHRVSAAKALLTPGYERYMAHASDSMFTDVISLTNVKVGKVQYYGVGQADVPCTFVIKQYRVGGWNNGPVTFAYQLTESASGAWKVSNGGTG
jgi:hypothetical protein